MPGVVVLSDIEAGIDAAPCARVLRELAPRSIHLDFGRSELGRAVLAVSLIDAVKTRFPTARISLEARPVVARILAAHIELHPKADVDLVLDLRPAIRRRASFSEGSPAILEVPSAPYPARVQHSAQHWIDGARASGFEPSASPPRLRIPREPGRALLQRVAPRSPVVVLASRPRAYDRAKLAEAGRELAGRIGARVFSVGRGLPAVPRLPSADPVECASAMFFSSVVIGDAGGWCDVAALVGAPTVGILGRASPTRGGPLSDVGMALFASCRSPRVHRVSRSRDRCLECLGARQVADAAEEIAARRWPWDWAARLGFWKGNS
jgi:ADP-heptose:LPS heptosyltransferase